MNEKKTSKITISIPLWLLVPIVWLNFFWPNQPSLILIGISMFFSFITYIIVFFIYANFITKKKLTFKQSITEKNIDSEYDLYWQIASIVSFAYTSWAGAYGSALNFMIYVYIFSNVLLLAWKFSKFSK